MAVSKSKMWVVLSDIHAPEEDKKAFSAVLDFLDKNKVEGVVLLGDNMDCQNVSRHTKNTPRKRERGGWQKELDYFAQNILDPIEARLKKGAKKVFHYGNHEDWLEQLLDEQPELEGALSISKSLGLPKRGWKEIKQGEHSMIGKAYLLHGDQVGSSKHVAMKLVESYSATAIMGHCHTGQMHVKTSQVKKEDKWAGYVLPCLSTVAPEYAKGRPNNQIQGFGIVEELPNGNINVYIVVVSNGQFSYGGSVYGK